MESFTCEICDMCALFNTLFECLAVSIYDVCIERSCMDHGIIESLDDVKDITARGIITTPPKYS